MQGRGDVGVVFWRLCHRECHDAGMKRRAGGGVERALGSNRRRGSSKGRVGGGGGQREVVGLACSNMGGLGSVGCMWPPSAAFANPLGWGRRVVEGSQSATRLPTKSDQGRFLTSIHSVGHDQHPRESSVLQQHIRWRARCPLD